MDKNDIMNSKKHQITGRAHRLPDGMGKIHSDYGLWILHYGQHNAQIDGYYKTKPRHFEYYSISHLHKGEGRLWLSKNCQYPISPGECVIITPNKQNIYGGVNGKPYIEDSICFYGPVADMLCKAGVLSDGVFEFGKARLLLPIQYLASDPSKDSQINANIALQKLLIDIYTKNRKLQHSQNSNQSVIEPLLKVIKEQITRWWTVDEMAEFCGFSKDHFRRIFKKETGMLPKTYIDKIKMQRASELLTSGNEKVANIAEKLSYHDPYHFSRRFKQITGFSPGQYRKEFGIGS